MADRSGLARVRGLAALAARRVARLEGHRGDARARFEQAPAAFDEAAMPMEAAVVHRETAELVAEPDPEVAAEDRAALHRFEQLGATDEADRARPSSGASGSAARPARRASVCSPSGNARYSI